LRLSLVNGQRRSDGVTNSRNSRRRYAVCEPCPSHIPVLCHATTFSPVLTIHQPQVTVTMPTPHPRNDAFTFQLLLHHSHHKPPATGTPTHHIFSSLSKPAFHLLFYQYCRIAPAHCAECVAIRASSRFQPADPTRATHTTTIIAAPRRATHSSRPHCIHLIYLSCDTRRRPSSRIAFSSWLSGSQDQRAIALRPHSVVTPISADCLPHTPLHYTKRA